MSNISKNFTRSQRSALSFFAMTAIAGYMTLFLLDKANDVVDDIDELENTPYLQQLRALEKELGGYADNAMQTYISPALKFSVSYPVTWQAKEQDTRVNFIDPLFREKGYVNNVASIQVLDVMSREEAIQNVFFVEENGLYFAVGRLGRKGDPAVSYTVNNNNIVVGDTAVAVYDSVGTYLGIVSNYRALISHGNRYVSMNILGDRELFNIIVSTFTFLNNQ